MCKLKLTAWAVAITLSVTNLLAGEETGETKPNVIFILVDDMGYGDVSALNKEGKINTPAIDKLASQGMSFTDAHTSASVCTPTRYGILTGRYNWRSTLKEGVLWGESPALIPKDRTTVASMMKNADYNTGFIGKWHLGWNFARDKKGNIDFAKKIEHTPNDLGFDYAYGHNGSLDMNPYVYVENGYATALPTDSTVNNGTYSFWRKGLTAPDFVHEDVTPNFFRRGIKYIKDNADDEKPFFLYLALPSPHTPILPTKEWQGRSGLNPYGDFVMMVDDYIAQLVDAVNKAGIESNTLIIFASDNGCSPRANIQEMEAKGHYANYISRGHKADIFEGGHHVPFIVKWPDEIKMGTQCDQTICTTDLMATLAEILHYRLKNDEGEDSYSLFPLFKQVKINGTFREATVHHSINGNFAIRKGDWKLAMCPGSGGWSYPRPGVDDEVISKLPKIQLYNLKDDPREQNNLQEEKPEIVTELKALLTKYIEEGRSTPGKPQKNDGEKIWPELWWMN